MKTLLRLLILLCPLSIMDAQNTPSAQEVVAEIGNQKLTAADLDQKEGGTLLQARYQYYMSQRKALDELIDSQLIAAEASKKGLPVDDLLQREVYKDIKDPTEDQLQVYYEGIDTHQSYSEVRTLVLEHIRQLRRNKARAAYIAELRKEADITVLLMPPVAELNLANTYLDGNRNAEIVLVEFADYECPYCEKVQAHLLQLKKDYGDKIAIAYKDFPLPMHQRAEKAAEAARCAGEQGKFWAFHNILYTSRALNVEQLKAQARVLGVEGQIFDQCLDSGAMAQTVKKDLDEGVALGLTGTPSFFVNGHFFSGAVDYAALKQMVDQQLTVMMKSKPQPTLSKK
jgi:protein-disulfide isomerase